jgi:hypothetical protein
MVQSYCFDAILFTVNAPILFPPAYRYRVMRRHTGMYVVKLGDHKDRRDVLMVESVVSPVRDIARDRTNWDREMTLLVEENCLSSGTRVFTDKDYIGNNDGYLYGNKLG